MSDFPILYGDPHAPLMVVIGAPAPEDLRAGVPLSGNDGRTLRAALSKAGLGSADHSVLTVVPEAEPFTKAEWAAAMARWYDPVRAALEGAEPRAILTVGPIALKVMMGMEGLEDVQGYVLTEDDKRPVRRKVLSVIGEYKTKRACLCKGKGCDKCSGRGLLHAKGDPKYGMVEGAYDAFMPPSAEAVIPTVTLERVRLSGFSLMVPFRAAVIRACRAASGDLHLVDLHSYSTTVCDPSEISGRHVAFDIETDMITGAIERIGFAYRIADGTIRTWTAPWNHHSREITRTILGDPRWIKVAHNISFDVLHLDAEGVKVVGPLFCTMHGAALLQPELRKGLEKVAPVYVDTVRWKDKSLTSPEYYNAADNTIELMLAEAEEFYIDRFGMTPCFQSMMRAYPTIVRMKQNGIQTDPAALEEWTAELKRDIALVMEEWKGVAPGVVPTSNPAVAKFLYGERRLPARFTKRGGYSVDADALAFLLSQRLPEIDRNAIVTLLTIRKLTKLLSTYTEAKMDPKHRIYADLIPMGKTFDDKRKGFPATGRLACANPNLQQQPPAARRVFVPSREDLRLCSMDWSQLEIRIIAALSGDRALAKACEGDIHAANMAALGVSERGLVKILLYLTCYGGGAKKIAAEMRAAGYNISQTEAKEFQRRLFRAYPDWDRWRNVIAANVTAQRYLINPFGRRRPFPNGSGDVTKAWDFDPQSSGGDMMWRILPEVEAAIDAIGGTLLMIVHDEVLFEAPIGADVAGVRDVMQQEFPEIAPGFRVPVSFKTGVNWRDVASVDGTVVPA